MIRPKLATAAALALAGLLGACSVPESSRGGGLLAPSTTTPLSATTVTTELRLDPQGESITRALEVIDTAEPPDGFAEGILVVKSDTAIEAWPVILAQDAAAQSKGLMGIDDFAALGGYAALVFEFGGEVEQSFWMYETPLRLRITFADIEGKIVSAADMVPCLPPTPSGDCPRYSAEGPYAFAVEHPSDPEFDIGLDSAHSIEVISHIVG